jgi:hypothetical protein
VRNKVNESHFSKTWSFLKECWLTFSSYYSILKDRYSTHFERQSAQRRVEDFINTGTALLNQTFFLCTHKRSFRQHDQRAMDSSYTCSFRAPWFTRSSQTLPRSGAVGWGRTARPNRTWLMENGKVTWEHGSHFSHFTPLCLRSLPLNPGPGWLLSPGHYT